MANKTQVIDALSQRLGGDRRAAAAAVDGFIDFVIREVDKGERVTITGFGSFEPRERAARTARNPRTGEAVTVKKATVPAFRAGTLFREVVSGTRKLPKAPAARATAARATAARPAAAPAAAPTRARRAAPSRPAAAPATPKPASKPAPKPAVVPPKPVAEPKAKKAKKAEKAAKAAKVAAAKKDGGKKGKKSGGKKKK